ncbi:MAG: DNA primase [Elainellaceae cyanobacterium]
MDIPRLHPDTIEQVKEKADIVDVVSEHVVLRKQGKDLVGLCPFHDDKSPSFSVSPSKQFYYCFSCGAGGNAIKFLMELGKRPFADVVLDLANRYHVPVQTFEPSQRQELQRQLSLREQLYEIVALAARFYEHALYQPQGEAAFDYLSSRRLSQMTIQQFQLGYAPAGWQTLYGYLVEQKRYPVELVEKAGLIVPRSGDRGYYDRFRDRLMIPIQDVQGRVIGFGGRALGDAQPKYLNSPETELFDKGKTLFALNKAKTAIAKHDRAVIVEGYFDAIALHASGIEPVVASLGTALSLAQIKQLLRYTESKQIILNFDADAAGSKAAERAIGEAASLAYRGEIQLRVLNIPDGKDPDDYLQSHTAADYQDLLDQAPLWIDWQIDNAFEHHDLDQAEQFHTVTQELVRLLGDIANANTRTHYIRRCAELLSRGDARLVPLLADNLLAQVRRKRRRSPDGSEIPRSLLVATDFLDQAEATLLRIYLHAPNYRDEVVKAIDERDLQFSLSHHRAIWRQILDLTAAEELDANPNLPPDTSGIPRKDLIAQLRDRCAEDSALLDPVSHLFQLDEKTQRDILRAPLVIQAATDCLERVMCEKRYRHFRDLWTQTKISDDPNLCRYYQQQIYAEKHRIAELDQHRSISFEDLFRVADPDQWMNPVETKSS